MAVWDFAFPFVRLIKTPVPDGLGGVVWMISDGDGFDAAVAKNTSAERLIAEAQGLQTQYTVCAPIEIALAQDDIIKRLSDGALFRVTSNAEDMQAPAPATAMVRFSIVNAERVTTA